MALVKGVATGIGVLVVLILLVSALGMVGTVELVMCAVLAAAAGFFVTRNQLRMHKRARSGPS